LEKYKSELFFTTVPMKLLDYDLNSESYSLDSRSYLIGVIKRFVKNESIDFYVQNFFPLIDLLMKSRKEALKEKQQIKVKKYETLICQIWEIMPNYLGNYRDYGFEDATYLQVLLKNMDKIVEKNLFSARIITLKNYCALIDFLKGAPKTDLKIKKARIFMMKKAVTYINSLSELYLQAVDTQKASAVSSIRENEHTLLLKTISKFGWLAKRVKLYDLFFNELTNIVGEFTNFETELQEDESMELDEQAKTLRNIENEATKKKILRKIDIIICLMERIKLSKRHCELIIKFADSIAKSKITQKKAFKILSIILESYEVTSYEELSEIFSQLTGYAFSATQQKQKLYMLKIFLSKIKKPKKEDDKMENDYDDLANNPVEDSDEDDPEEEMKKIEVNDEQRQEIINTILPEIITGFYSVQAKSKKISESLLIDLVKLCRNHFNEFLKKLLAGFAGDTVDTRASTLTILTKVLKTNSSDFTETNLVKITKIILLFLKQTSSKLQKSVLKCLKVLLSIISLESLTALSSEVLPAVISFEGRQKLNIYVRYIIGKFIKKLGKATVKDLVPDSEAALVDYVEKMIKKEAKQLKKSRQVVMDDEEERERDRLIEGERVDDFKDSDDESSESDSDDDEYAKRDANIADFDIPVVRHLKEIEAGNDEETKGEKPDRKAQVEKVLQTVDDEFSSHFYDNPILLVKKRKAERKRLEEINKRQIDREERIRNRKEVDDEDDLFYEKKTRKFVVKDTMKNERQVKQAQKRKRVERDEYINQVLPKEVRQMIDLEEKARSVHKRKRVNEKEDIDDFVPMKYVNKGKNDKSKEGHFIKQSGSSFKGKGGKSDILKSGQYEPYAYIKLNPKMINKRFRDKAVKSFGTVVEKKKQDKRKVKDGMFAGATIKKK